MAVSINLADYILKHYLNVYNSDRGTNSMVANSPQRVVWTASFSRGLFKYLGRLLGGLALAIGLANLPVQAQNDAQSNPDDYGNGQPMQSVQDQAVSYSLGDSANQTSVPPIVDAKAGQNGGAQPAKKEEDTKKKAEEEKKKKEELEKKVAGAFKPVFFNNDFSYLNDPNYTGFWFGDNLKRRCLPRGGWYDIGGETRFRYDAERNHRGLGLTGVDDDFVLRRNRLYGDFHMSENFRVYAEMIDALSYYENFSPRAIEENRFDMLNLFVDANLLKDGSDSLVLRTGRQELLYGAQRVISPLDWANTRRTFEGVSLMRKTEDYSIDAFWTHPVRVVPNSFDNPDRDQEFMGIYSSYTGVKDQTLDFYTLRYLNGSGANEFKINTFGSRWQGSRESFLWDFEGAYQSGDNTDSSSHNSGALTFGLGRKLREEGWKPTLWAYYDWASGDDARGAGNGYHHLFPLAHRYNGFMDLFGRRNLEDVNLMFTMQPTKKLNLLIWYHYFFLENQNDTPYSVVMTPFNPGNAPGSANLGHELDFLATYNVTVRQQAQLGYSHFFAGDYYATTPGVPYNGNAAFFYAQWSVSY